MFLEGSACAPCHSESRRAEALRDPDGESIAPYNLWRASMMANASRDPLWRAFVAIETHKYPTKKAEIEDKCLSCHAPMASRHAHADGRKLTMEALGQDFPNKEEKLADDGVSCSLCHQIVPERLGTPASYSGHFVTGTKNQIFGPHKNPPMNPMRAFTGYTPTQADHMTKSSLCGSCHTLETHALTEDGHESGDVFVEQSPYLEWRNSVFNDEVENPSEEAQSCQDCHLPTTNDAGKEIQTNIARNPMGTDFSGLESRKPVGRHLFIGGNALVPQLLRDMRNDLGILTPASAFDVVAERARTQLATKTAALRIGPDAVREGDELKVPVTVINLTGHKFPSAHPIRRAWLRLRVLDKDGKVIFESGGFDLEGRILGKDGEPLATELPGGGYQPWHGTVSSADQAQIFETVMADYKGNMTFFLMAAANHLKDTRILPKGWSLTHEESKKTSPQGVAFSEAFSGDGATTIFEFTAPPDRGPYRIEASVHYQTLGSRFAAEVLNYQHLEPVKRFAELYHAETVDRTPVTVAEAVVITP